MKTCRGEIGRILVCVGLLVLAFAQTLKGQQGAAEEKQFAETRAKAEKGDAQAQFILGYYYTVGFGVMKDEGKGVIWYRKAADQNLAGAQYNLGECYDYGQGVAKDMVEAFKWYRKAAEQNLPEAEFNVGVCYKHGDGVGLNYVEAANWYRKAAEQNYADASSIWAFPVSEEKA